MTTCVFIIGTNATGKSTLARNLAGVFGGMDSFDGLVTTTKEGSICFGGKYGEGKYGGIDYFSKTSNLRQVVEHGVSLCGNIVCEGSKLHTFGMNLTNAIFQSECQIVVCLYAPSETLNERLLKRGKKGVNKTILQDQRQCIRSAAKWKEIGVCVCVCVILRNYQQMK